MREAKRIRLEEEKKKSEKILFSLIIAMFSLLGFVIMKFQESSVCQIIKWVFFGVFAFCLVRMKLLKKK